MRQHDLEPARDPAVGIAASQALLALFACRGSPYPVQSRLAVSLTYPEVFLRTHVAPIVAALAVVGAFSLVVHAQNVKPDRAIKYRQGIMNAQGWHLGILAAMAKGERPYDKDVAVRSATFVSELLQMPFDGFIPGSDQGAPTKAKPEIWTEPAKFKQLQEAAQAESLKLVAAAKTGDVNQLRTAVGAMGKACKDFHEDFQAK
jgi:cytochrome c556